MDEIRAKVMMRSFVLKNIHWRKEDLNTTSNLFPTSIKNILSVIQKQKIISIRNTNGAAFKTRVHTKSSNLDIKMKELQRTCNKG